MFCKWQSKDNERIDALLRREIPVALNKNIDVSNSKIRRLIMAGCVSVNGSLCRNPSFILRKNSIVTVNLDEKKFFYEKKPDDIDFELTEKDVLFEDDCIIVVNKPAFYPSEPTIVKDRGNMQAAVINYLWKKNPSLRNPPYVGIMHRLDRETSGVLLFTKTRSVNNAVHEMFEKHTAKKQYRAVCTYKGNSTKKDLFKEGNTFTVDNYIGRISPKSAECKIGVLSKDRGGQSAHTDFKTVGVNKQYYYIDCFLLTGRTHQIRVHLSSLGLPLVGDELYGGVKGFDECNDRIMLHACQLSFSHPVTKEIIVVNAPLPQGFAI